MLESPFVEFGRVDEEGNTLEDLLRAEKHLGALTISEGLKLFETAKKRNITSDRKKGVIIVVNSKYSDRCFEDLPGTREDLKLALKIFKARNYTTKVIEDSPDILKDVRQFVNQEGFKESARDVCQLLYLGHGTHIDTVEKHERSINQKGEFGNCLVGVDGKYCSEVALALVIAQGLREDTKICLLYDMCRVQLRVSLTNLFFLFNIKIHFHFSKFSQKKSLSLSNSETVSWKKNMRRLVPMKGQ